MSQAIPRTMLFMFAAALPGLVLAAGEPAPPAAAAAAADQQEPAEAFLPVVPPRPGGTILADSSVLVYRAGQSGPGPRTLSDLGEEEARLIREINRTHGTWTSYQLATSRDFGVKLFHHGFTITLPPPRRKPRTAATQPTAAARPSAAPEPGEGAPPAAPTPQR